MGGPRRTRRPPEAATLRNVWREGGAGLSSYRRGWSCDAGLCNNCAEIGTSESPHGQRLFTSPRPGAAASGSLGQPGQCRWRDAGRGPDHTVEAGPSRDSAAADPGAPCRARRAGVLGRRTATDRRTHDSGREADAGRAPRRGEAGRAAAGGRSTGSAQSRRSEARCPAAFSFKTCGPHADHGTVGCCQAGRGETRRANC